MSEHAHDLQLPVLELPVLQHLFDGSLAHTEPDEKHDAKRPVPKHTCVCVSLVSGRSPQIDCFALVVDSRHGHLAAVWLVRVAHRGPVVAD